jgi:hypothetical protein
VVRGYELLAAVQDQLDDANAWNALLDLAID